MGCIIWDVFSAPRVWRALVYLQPLTSLLYNNWKLRQLRHVGVSSIAPPPPICWYPVTTAHCQTSPWPQSRSLATTHGRTTSTADHRRARKYRSGELGLRCSVVRAVVSALWRCLGCLMSCVFHLTSALLSVLSVEAEEWSSDVCSLL